MATRRAVANGNWSASATWDIVTGGVPTAGDDVYADGYTVTLDQNITVASINTTQRSGGTAGGRFEFTANRTINANVNAGTSTCLSAGATSYNLTATVNGNIVGGSVAAAYGLWMTSSNDGTSRAIITGNVTSGSGEGALFCNAAATTRYFNVAITGNVTSTAGNITITCTNTGKITGLTVVGDMTAVGAVCGQYVDVFSLVGNGYGSNYGIVSPKATTSNATIAGSLSNSGGINVLETFRVVYFSPTLGTAWKFQDTDGADKRLYTEGYFACPDEEDVREGTTYGLKTGTLAVPSPSNVASGVPTDNTVGTADFALTEVMDALDIINGGVKNASILVPHTIDI